MVTFRPLDTGLAVRHRHEVLTIEAWGEDSVRAARHRLPAESHGALGEPPPSDPPVVQTAEHHATLVHGDLANGGSAVEAEAPLERIPVFTREGSRIPLKESV